MKYAQCSVAVYVNSGLIKFDQIWSISELYLVSSSALRNRLEDCEIRLDEIPAVFDKKQEFIDQKARRSKPFVIVGSEDES